MVLGEKLKLYEYRLPLESGHREGLILQSDTGFGEIAPLPGFSRETLAEAREEIIAVLRNQAAPRLPSVRWGMACARKKLQSIRLPLCSLGPRAGFNTIKLKLGHLPVEEAISLVKKHLHSSLRLDCNRAWTLDQALTFAHHFTPTDFVYLEEPVRDFQTLIQFSKLTHFPIALDESIGCDSSKIPSLKAIVIKPTLVGAIPIIPPHLDLVLSSSYESGLGLLHIANVYHTWLETWNFDRAKTAGIDDRKLVNIRNMDQFTIVDSSEFSRGSKSKFQAACGIANNLLPLGLDTYRALRDDILKTPIDCSAGYFSWESSDPPVNFDKLCPIVL